jgi:hypothetical protein
MHTQRQALPRAHTHAYTHRDTQRHTETHRDTQTHTDIQRQVSGRAAVGGCVCLCARACKVRGRGRSNFPVVHELGKTDGLTSVSPAFLIAN